MARFPSVQSLASADEADVLSSWQGLGYYRRCRMMLQCARVVAEIGWPDNAIGLKKLPGIGDYTAAAIASICFGEPAPLVDGNVQRVYARVAADRAYGQTLTKNAWKWAAKNFAEGHPGEWNQALMELGAFVCRPTNPSCPLCPLKAACIAYKKGVQNQLPTRMPKKSPTLIEKNLVIHRKGNALGVRQIPDEDWAARLWEFREEDHPNGEPVGIVNHTITKHKIKYRVHVSHEVRSELRYVTREELKKLGMPSAQWKALAVAENRLSKVKP